ncbi:MAG: hypothetical protein J0I06_28830 [Planctomycetes bacterium]|nr:hypothetical protein [Planctomycetota bacterium]
MTTETRSEGTGTVTEVEKGEESFADRVLSLVAMGGAVGGAVAGAALGSQIGSAFPVVCGGLGTMLGSGLIAGGWCLLVGLWTGRSDGNGSPHEIDRTADRQPVAAAHGAA